MCNLLNDAPKLYCVYCCVERFSIVTCETVKSTHWCRNHPAWTPAVVCWRQCENQNDSEEEVLTFIYSPLHDQLLKSKASKDILCLQTLVTTLYLSLNQNSSTARFSCRIEAFGRVQRLFGLSNNCYWCVFPNVSSASTGRSSWHGFSSICRAWNEAYSCTCPLGLLMGFFPLFICAIASLHFPKQMPERTIEQWFAVRCTHTHASLCWHVLLPNASQHGTCVLHVPCCDGIIFSWNGCVTHSRTCSSKNKIIQYLCFHFQLDYSGDDSE